MDTTRRLATKLALAALLVGVSGCAGHRPGPGDEFVLRVLTLNIHHGEGTDGVFDLPRIASLISASDPGVVLLQEVDVGTRRSSGIDQATELARLTGMEGRFAEAMPYQGGSYGEALLTRTPPRVTRAIALPCETGQEPRAAVAAELAPWGAEGPSLWVVGTHLCHQSASTRARQSRALLEALPVGPPTVLAGDMNFTADEEGYRVLDGRFLDAPLAAGLAEPTIPVDSPSRRIDHVFVDRGSDGARAWRVLDSRTIDPGPATDHRGVLVELALRRAR